MTYLRHFRTRVNNSGGLELCLLVKFRSRIHVPVTVSVGGYEPGQMNEKDQITSVNRSEKTAPGDREARLATPYFDAAAIKKAQPAVPLKEIKIVRSRPTTTLLTVALLSGLAGGIIGGLLPTLFLKDDAQQQTAASQQVPASTAVAEGVHAQGSSVTPEAGGETSLAESDAGEQTETERAGQGATPKELETTLRSALKDWVAATNARDIDRQMIFYTPVVEAFYRARNASREDVRRDKARVFERASSIDIRTGAPDILLSPDGRTAIMRFHKRYEILGGGEDRRGEVVQELRWQLTGGEWRITSERDLRVVR